MHFTTAALAASLSFFASAQSIRGFNSGNLNIAGGPKTQSDFQAEFQNQKNIVGSNGVFTNTRLYTMIQGGTTNTPISAIPAAIASNTGLLLGLWASAGQESFNQELAALSAAIKQYGSQMAPLIRGISVGSEDLYRETPAGIASNAGTGANAAALVNYIGQVRSAIQGTVLADVQIGHVDTWTAWTNTTNSALFDHCDWVGLDEYPYYQTTDANGIANAGELFYAAYDATHKATGKPVWVTESGWPDSGPTVGDAVASLANAHSYWEQVYCTLPADTPVYWYTQVNDNTAGNPSFGITGADLTTTPIFDLSCKKSTTSSSSVKSTSSTKSSSSAKSTKVVGSDSFSTRVSDAKPTTSSGASGYIYSTGTHASGKSVSGGIYRSTLTSAPYPTGSGAASTVVGTATAVPTPTVSPSPTTSPIGANGAVSLQSTLALLAVPAVIAFLL